MRAYRRIAAGKQGAEPESAAIAEFPSIRIHVDLRRDISNSDRSGTVLEFDLMQTLKVSVAAALFLSLAAPAHASDLAAGLTELAVSRFRQIAQSPELVDAIRAQNETTVDYDQSTIDELDSAWRSEAESVEQPMIAEALATPSSKYLAAAREESDGLLTEIFAMDARGLNVALSDATSDFWQGDEAKWTETFMVGPDAVHVSEAEGDESTLIRQSQVSISVVDPDTGVPIGAVTFGVDVDMLP
jgi:hypothetical protein